MPRERSRFRDKRSSSRSSDSSRGRKKSKRKRRSQSREKSESKSLRRKRSTSRSKQKRRSYSRSVSRERYEKRKRSSSQSYTKRGQSHSRSSSRSRSKYKSHKKKSKRRSPSSSRSSSVELVSEHQMQTKFNLDDTETKVERAIKAAEAAGLTMTKIPTYEYKEVAIKEDMPTIHDRNLLAELNCDSFVQKAFTSSRSKKETKNIVIDLNSDTVMVPEVEVKQKEKSIINLDELPSEEELREIWIKKLYQYRKKMLRGEI